MRSSLAGLAALASIAATCQPTNAPPPGPLRCELPLAQLVPPELGATLAQSDGRLSVPLDLTRCEDLSAVPEARLSLEGHIVLRPRDGGAPSRHSASGGTIAVGAASRAIDCEAVRDAAGAWPTGPRTCVTRSPLIVTVTRGRRGFGIQLTGNWFYGDQPAVADLRRLTVHVVAVR